MTAVTSGVVGLLIAAVTYGGPAPAGKVFAGAATSTTRPVAVGPRATTAPLPLVDPLAPPELIEEVLEVPVSSAPEPDGAGDGEDKAPTSAAKPPKPAADDPAPPPPPPKDSPATRTPTFSPPSTQPRVIFRLPRSNPDRSPTTTTTTTAVDPGGNNKPGEPPAPPPEPEPEPEPEPTTTTTATTASTTTTLPGQNSGTPN